ncbi:MAG: 30S ribosomal protein S4 [Candidatus Heimdallarchaeota archaeon]|nr:30S ribosomal protein S4 [Candidatus Heimdallarchaeota archaeon]MBY8993137.1 30S ribosomal protein S4 [Candidatus Heimdallarchaeota archaeon]
MGDPRKIRKKYKTPRQPFERHRIDHDIQIVGKYGLRNMKAVWKLSTMLRNFRGNARKLLSLEDEDRKIGEQELLGRLQRMGLVSKKATLDDVLSLQIENFLERRLQTLVFKKGLATTPHHSRQMIVHGHILIGDRIAKSPSYLVSPTEESLLTFTPTSPYRKTNHKALPANVIKGKKPRVDRRGDRRRGPPGRDGQRRRGAPPPRKDEAPKDTSIAEEAPLLKVDKKAEEITEISEKAEKVVPKKLKDEL